MLTKWMYVKELSNSPLQVKNWIGWRRMGQNVVLATYVCMTGLVTLTAAAGDLDPYVVVVNSIFTYAENAYVFDYLTWTDMPQIAHFDRTNAFEYHAGLNRQTCKVS